MKPKPEGKRDWGETLEPVIGVVLTILMFLIQVLITTFMLMIDGFATIWNDGKRRGG